MRSDEVGPLMDALTGIHDTQQKDGAVGFLTRGPTVREDVFTLMVACAMTRFSHPELYEP